MSGSRVTMRAATSLQANPSAPTLRRIRSTLYWLGESPMGLRITSRPCMRASAVRWRFKKASSSRLSNGLVGLISVCSRRVMVAMYILLTTTIVKRSSWACLHSCPGGAPTRVPRRLVTRGLVWGQARVSRHHSAQVSRRS
jgi:hypothetical protein